MGKSGTNMRGIGCNKCVSNYPHTFPPISNKHSNNNKMKNKNRIKPKYFILRIFWTVFFQMPQLNKLALLLLPVLCASRSIDIVRTISNPHQDQIFESGNCKIGDDCPLVGTLDVSKIALDQIATQPGTFLGLYRKMVRGVEVRFV